VTAAGRSRAGSPAGSRVDGRELEATTLDPDAVGDGGVDGRADCLVVDCAKVGSESAGVVAACAEKHPELPVIVLADGTDRLAVEALEAGATETLPRGVTDAAPEVFAESLVSAVEREHARSGIDDLYDGVGSYVTLHDPGSGEVIDANERFREELGYSRERVRSAQMDAFTADVDGYDGDRAADAVGSVGDGSVELEWPFETAEGTVRWMEATLTAATFGGREVVMWASQDVTERRQLERTYKQVFEGVSDGLVVHDPETGEIRDVNDRYCALTGYDREELVGGNLRLIVPEGPEDTYEDALGRIERAREAGPQLFEFEGQRSDGERFVGEVHLSVIELRGEEQVLASVRDVTERKRREREYEQIFNGVNDAVAVRDPETGQLVEVNESYADLLGYDREEMIGMSIGDVGADDRADTDHRGMSIIERVMRGEDPVEFEWRVETAGGGQRLMDVTATAATINGRERYLAIARDVTERREYERRLEAVLDRIDESIFLAPVAEINDVEPAPDYVSAGYETVYGQSLERMHESHDEGFFGILHPDEYEGYREFVDRIHTEVEAGRASDRYTREYRIELPGGEIRWIHSDYYPTEWGEAADKIVIVSRDITERKRRERTLESFHDATAELTTADTAGEAGRIAVRAAADVFELPATAVYHYDSERGCLEPVACGPAVESDPRTLTAEDGPAWAGFVEERMRRIGVEEVPALAVGPTDEVLLVPLGGNGVLVIWHSGEAFDPDAANIIAASVEAAFNRLRGERQLESRSQELAVQAERARRLEAVTELIQRVEAAITTESSRRDIQQAVCDELTEAALFEGAWIAEAEVGTDRLTPRAVAGTDSDRAEQALANDTTDGDPRPAREAWRTGEPAVVNDLLGGGRRSGWRRTLLGHGTGSVCAVPLGYDGVTHGVLVILAGDPDAFDDHVVDVLDQLGTSIGHAIVATERRRALESDDTLELEFRGTETGVPFARLAREAGCHVRHERTVRRQDGSVSVYYTLADDPPADVESAIAGTLPGTIRTVTRESGSAVIERRGSSWFGSAVSEYGGVLRRGRATPSGVTLVVELPREADTRTIVERVREAFPALELTAQRQHREGSATPGELKGRLGQRLSDRQYEALETAHALGYFEWPRESSGEEVAAALGITQPTVNKHIRIGERKLFDLLFGTTGGPTV
jgi:PAS domain S-box-containing protein